MKYEKLTIPNRTNFLFCHLNICVSLQCNFGVQTHFLPSMKSFDNPLHTSGFSVIFYLLRVVYFLQFVIHVGCLSWAGEFYNYIASFYLLHIIRFNSQQHLQTISIRLINKGIDSEWRNKFTRNSIVHHSKLPLWWLYLQSSVDIKLTGVHSLIEIAIIKHDETQVGVTLTNSQILW